MTIFSSIRKPTLILDEDKAKQNLSFIHKKISEQGIEFRPHFKTHQSAEVGEWFRELGIKKITVSSVEMASYFCEHNWNDILIAFPVNLLQLEELVDLSAKTNLSLLFEDVRTVAPIDSLIHNKISGWIKIDTGANRCGLKENQINETIELADALEKSKNIEFKGLVTHAGHSYRVNEKSAIHSVYEQSVKTLFNIREILNKNGFSRVDISVGDTPTSRLVDDFLGIDELRPGNFLFYDVQQYQAGVCGLEEIAVALACPVVAVHQEQNEVVLYGGAIHLSKDSHIWGENQTAYGLITLPNNDGSGWVDSRIIGYVRSLSQEHAVVVCNNAIPDGIHPGSILCVLPAHSCLTVQAMGKFMNLDGESILTMVS